jgi:hypothetical protein
MCLMNTILFPWQLIESFFKKFKQKDSLKIYKPQKECNKMKRLQKCFLYKDFWKLGHFDTIQSPFKYQMFCNDTSNHNLNYLIPCTIFKWVLLEK